MLGARGVETARPRHDHRESHFKAGDSIRDVVIGMSDGLTVPFALAAGISSAVQSTHLVVTAGLAEIAAGSIAMGLGGYLAARAETEHYDREHRREGAEISERPDGEAEEVLALFATYGVEPAEAAPVLAALRRRPADWTDLMIRLELGLERPAPRRALLSALTIGFSYGVGGFVPLLPYMVVTHPGDGLAGSVGITLVALSVFGGIKGAITEGGALKSAATTVLTGGVAASAAFALARAVA